ncbi:MAG: zinc-dependent metalloprotease [Planctomycetota bacterium]
MPTNTRSRRRPGSLAAALLSVAGFAMAAQGQKPEFPPLEKITDGFTEVTPSRDGGMLKIWINEKTGQALAELPRKLERSPFYLLPTVAAGDREAGVYAPYAQGGQGVRQLYWRRYDKTLALVQPQQAYRSSGDKESKNATERVFTDSVVMSMPILAMGPNGGPVIDLDQMLVGNASTWLGGFGSRMQTRLMSIDKAKVFPYNAEIAFEVPRANGKLVTLHFSLGQPPKSPGFTPRIADRRVGFFYTDYTDRAKNDGESQTIRYANRWHLEKRDPSLRMSPPAEPIVYYMEHTTPVRYRRWVRDGILAWNKAFEQVGIVGAVEVRQQDATTGAYMDIDPEDIRYSFVRWTNAHMGYAIGPSSAHPETGEIYEADIVLDEGFIGGWAGLVLDTEIASMALAGLDAETMAFLDEHDSWDPRVRLANPADRNDVIDYKTAMREGRSWEGDVPATMQATNVAMTFEGAHDALTCSHAVCQSMRFAALNMGMARAAFDMGIMGDHTPDGEGEEAEEVTMLDGVPEDFIGPLLRWVTMHEVGHTLGLMHNWKGTSRYTYEEINNTPENGGIMGEVPWSVSVMDYPVVNIVVEDGNPEIEQGDYAILDIGSYDKWAIEWGYTFDDPNEVARKAADPDHAFLSDEGSMSPDPLAKVFDFGKDPLTHAKNRIQFADKWRDAIEGKIVEDNESWQKAREAYGRALSTKFSAAMGAAHWVGGAHVNNYRKGDPGATDPIVPADMDTQRKALAFVLEQTFRDEAYGITPELLAKLGVDSWWDENFAAPRDYPIHDQVLGFQAATMTTLLNPTRLRRVLDNEVRVPADEDALTVPELLETIRTEAWSELESPRGRFTAREPMISTTRRNLQREHVSRLIDLTRGYGWGSASGQVIRQLARHELREMKDAIEGANGRSLDPYTSAHFADCIERIEKALDANFLQVD